jgi:hypothetical protein
MKFHFSLIGNVKRKRKVNTVLTSVTHNEGKGNGKGKVDHRARHEGPEWE